MSDAPKIGMVNRVKDPTSINDFTLTKFQLDFVTAFISPDCPSAAEAVRRAGSTSKQPNVVANNTLKIPEVAAALAFLQRSRMEAAGVDSVTIVQMARDVYVSAMRAGKFADANKSIELLAKFTGLWNDQGKDNRDPNKVGTGEDRAKLEKTLKDLASITGNVVPIKKEG